MLKFLGPLFLLFNLSLASGLECRDFYSFDTDLKDLELFDSQVVRPDSRKIQEALRQHYSLRKITLESTKLAFDRFLEIIDPNRIFLTKEDLESFGYPQKTFFSGLHRSLFLRDISPVHSGLLRLALSRMQSMVKKYISDSKFRQRILDLAESKAQKEGVSFSSRLEKESEIEGHFANFMAEFLSSLKTNQEVSETYTTSNQWLSSLNRILKEYYKRYTSDINEMNLSDIVAKSYFQVMDAHTDLLLPKERENLMSLIGARGDEVGIGVHFRSSSEPRRVLHVEEKGPADNAKLQAGDEILAIRPLVRVGLSQFFLGKEPTPLSPWYSIRTRSDSEVSKLIRGQVNSHLQIRVRRNGMIMELLVKRTKYGTARYSSYSLQTKETSAGNIGFLKFNVFHQGIAKEIIPDLKLRTSRENLKGLVIDLRGNGGGSAQEATDLIGAFLSKEKIAKIYKSKKGETAISVTPSRDQFNRPTVILIDERSASASEVFAGALQAYHKAIVVGSSTSFGKGSSQSLFSDSGFKVTDSLFFTPSGKAIQHWGVASDITLLSKSKKPAMEKDLMFSLAPEDVESRVNEVSQSWNTLVNRLKQNSMSRLASKTKPFDESNVDKENLAEAFRIVEDWLQFSESK